MGQSSIEPMVARGQNVSQRAWPDDNVPMLDQGGLMLHPPAVAEPMAVSARGAGVPEAWRDASEDLMAILARR